MPGLTKREKNRRAFVTMMDERGLTREATAKVLHVTVNAIKAWVKKEGVAGANPVPLWAPELLAFKVYPKYDGPPIEHLKPRSLGVMPAVRKALKKRAAR